MLLAGVNHALSAVQRVQAGYLFRKAKIIPSTWDLKKLLGDFDSTSDNVDVANLIGVYHYRVSTWEGHDLYLTIRYKKDGGK